MLFKTCLCLSDPGIENSVLAGHEDSVWGLTYSAAHHRLASCSADGTIRIWDPQNSAPCLSVFNKERGRHLCTACSFSLEVLYVLFCTDHFLSSPRAWNPHLSGICSHWPQPGGGVIWCRRDTSLWPQHRAEHHCAGNADKRWCVRDLPSSRSFRVELKATN